MQLTQFLISLIAFNFINRICADSVEFNLLSIRSGSELQYASISPNEDNIMQVGLNNHSTGVVTDDGFLKINNDYYMTINEKNQYALTENKSDAICGFAVRDAKVYLKYPFVAHKEEAGWVLYSTSQIIDDYAIAIAPMTPTGQFAPNFPSPDNSIFTTTLSPA